MQSLISSGRVASRCCRWASKQRSELGIPILRTGLSANTAAFDADASSYASPSNRMQTGYNMPAGRNSQPAVQDTSAALVRRPQAVVPAPQQVLVDMTQVVGKQVITRTTGRDLGVVSCMWVDPKSAEVVSLDLDDKKGVGSTRIANIYLSRLTQIGDVVLVHDEQVLYDQPLDGRYGFMLLTGMEVRTRNGDFLGKVRDFSFSPDTGAVSKIMYDDFGLSFLPVTFFDTFSVSMSDVLSVGPSGVIVNEDAKYRERKETSGLFAAIPSLLRAINSGSSSRAPVALLGSGQTTDAYRQGQDYYLPQGYSYEQWENDVKRWEVETGLNYEQYIRSQAQGSRSSSRQLAAAATTRPALPSTSSAGQGMQYGQPMQQQQQPQQNNWQGIGAMQRPQPPRQQQQQQQYPGQIQRPMQQRPQPADPRYRQASPPAQNAPYGGGMPDGAPQRMQRGTKPMLQQPQQQGMQQQQRPPMQQQQQPASPAQAQAAESSGRRMDEYLVREDRPRVRELAMEGVPEQSSSGWPDGLGAKAKGQSWNGYYAAQNVPEGQQQQQPPLQQQQ